MSQKPNQNDVDKSGPQPSKAKSNYPGQEHETLQKHKTEKSMAEPVRDAVEDPDCLRRAKEANWQTTGEPARAGRIEDVVKAKK